MQFETDEAYYRYMETLTTKALDAVTDAKHQDNPVILKGKHQDGPSPAKRGPTRTTAATWQQVQIALRQRDTRITALETRLRALEGRKL